MLHFEFNLVSKGTKGAAGCLSINLGPVLFARPEARLYNDWTGHTMVTDSSSAAI